MVGAGKSKIYRLGHHAGNTGQRCGNVEFKGSPEADSLFLQGTLIFSVKAFNWLDEDHTHYGGYSVSLSLLI